ncbi:unnamed protein product [Paramecium octaurelia]|uniref:RING-type domain-containing protein n=1 Tax=Paramecium octaurelia TaxID=43137 RepID=A0A8S1UAD7_PAROT|nr:unnamed protein product [Paramecium octaurelia]
MAQIQEFTLRFSMTHSKNELLDYINERKIYFPHNLESRLLKWNCYPLINFDTEELEVSFGVFFLQILKLSQNQTVRDQFSDLLNCQLNNLQKVDFIKICHRIFQKESLNPFPQSNEFKSLGDNLKESFVYEKHISDKPPSYYKSQNGNLVFEINEQEVKYRILLYKKEDESRITTAIIFSTNNDIRRVFPLQNQVFIPNSFNQSQQTYTPSHFIPNNQKFVINQSVQFQEQNNNYVEGRVANIQPLNGQPKQSSMKDSPAFQQVVFQQQPFQSQQQQHQQQQYQKQQQQNQQQQQQQPYQYQQQYQQLNQPQQYQQQQPQFQQPQQQYQQFQKQSKLSTNFVNVNTNTNIINNSYLNFNYNNIAHTNTFNFQLNGNQQVSQLKPQQKSNDVLFISTETIQQFQDKSRAPIFNSSSLPCNSSQQNTSAQVKPEEIDVLSTQQINQISQVEKDTQMPTESRIQTNIMARRQQEPVSCQICTMNYSFDPNEALMTPCCLRKVHADCYQQDLHQKAIQFMNFDLVTCYSCKNSLKGQNDFLKNNISISLYGEIVKRTLLAQIPLKCCKCQQPIQASQEILSKQVMLKCLSCDTKLCSLCRQEYHGENQQNQSCPSLLVDIQNAFKNMPILVCPFCQLIQTKDDKCNHVRCFSCQKDLCSACSVDRIPILAHGNHYHREGCPDYKPWIKNNIVVKQKEFDKQSCQRCKESGKPCEYPMSLQEYKKLKQF